MIWDWRTQPKISGEFKKKANAIIRANPPSSLLPSDNIGSPSAVSYYQQTLPAPFEITDQQNSPNQVLVNFVGSNPSSVDYSFNLGGSIWESPNDLAEHGIPSMESTVALAHDVHTANSVDSQQHWTAAREVNRVCEDHIIPANKSTENEQRICWKCSWRGCHLKTFKRKYELDRHMKKHTGVSILCPIVYCSKQFYRPDKLDDHLRQGHTEGEEGQCQVSGCSQPPMPLVLLRVHARYHSRYRMFSELTSSRGFLQGLNNHGWEVKCDLKKCKRWFYRPSELQKHLETHDLGDRVAQWDIVKRMGFDPNTLQVICPVCAQQFRNPTRFESHL